MTQFRVCLPVLTVILAFLMFTAPARAGDAVYARGDMALGAKDAPVTIIEYASMSCSHCAAFHKNMLPWLKETYIETGKVRFVFRDFPLNVPAVWGAMTARCAKPDR